ncbi:helix-hairpin-helix domain-containing protein [Streptomyces buecherae]|uniref:ATP-binding domain-containing protein n=1 Tax=Streptomyces buecherae TaxID=2763006 RepID=A0A7H8NF89_9ACTN|nr:helix-hairpin-helix domain-containing protein [Streptomyces buecherae]QKW53129.1 ATP-binding domain-containing protein [Streptomyces buecherae]
MSSDRPAGEAASATAGDPAPREDATAPAPSPDHPEAPADPAPATAPRGQAERPGEPEADEATADPDTTADQHPAPPAEAAREAEPTSEADAPPHEAEPTSEADAQPREAGEASEAGPGAESAAEATGGARVAAPSASDAGAGGSAGGGKRSAAAEALAAAVRAVERGEADAASFFTSARGRSTAARPGGARPNSPGHAAPTPGAPQAATPHAAGPAGPAGGAPTAPSGGAGSGGAPASEPAPTATAGAPAAAGPGAGPSGVGSPAGGAGGARVPSASAAGGPAELDGIRQVLAAGGAPPHLAEQVVRALGEGAGPVLRDDPWQLLAVPGVRPEQADGFARALLGPDCGPGDERRSRALVTWLLERAALEGHTARESAALRDALAQHAVPDPDEALRDAVAEGVVLVFQDALETPGVAPAAEDDEAEQPVRVLLGLDRYALAEESLADGLARVINTFEPDAADSAPGARPETDAAPESDAEPEAEAAGPAPDWEALADAAPSPSAAELVRAAAGHGLVTHSGGESARAEAVALVAAAHARGLRAYAAAHTDDGRGRLGAALADSGLPAALAVTVAGLLAGAEGPGRDADGAFRLDLLAVLDAPQLDVEAAAALVESLPDGVRLVLSGDPGVLWSAGAGRVFADVVAARACPQVVSRTPDPGPIGELVSGIGIGELSQVEAPGKEVVIVPVRDAGDAVHRTVQLVADSVPRAIGVPVPEIQVITVGHGGAVGTRALNAALKERLNPGPGRFGGFDPGDRVAYAVAPGRTVTGTVTAAEPDGLRLDCGGEDVLVPRARVADALRPGWAVTAHQAAGRRWPATVVVLPGDAGPLLTRAWVYTAFSRGERHLSVVHGAGPALPHAVAEVPAAERTTRLRALLRAQNATA